MDLEHKLSPAAEDIGGLLLAGTESLDEVFDILKTFGSMIIQDLCEQGIYSDEHLDLKRMAWVAMLFGLDSCLTRLGSLGVTYMSVREPHLQSLPVSRVLGTAYAHRRSFCE